MSEVNGTAMEMEPDGGLVPEQDEVSRPAVVDTKDEWTCDNCTTTNSVADNQVCRECGSPYVSEKLAELGVTQTGVMAVAGALVEHAHNAADAESVENAARKPTDVPLPLEAEGDTGDGFERFNANCPWERANPGHVCIVCREAKKKNLNPDAASAVHPEHDDHADTAEAAFNANVITPLIPKLKAKGLAITADELLELDADQLQTLIDWAEQDGPVPPAILATSHVAAAPGTMAQVCKDCNIDLAFSTDPEGFYEEGIRVGLDCEAKVVAIVEAAEAGEPVEPEPAAVEAARTPKSHAKKNAAKKREPEKERTEQLEAGKKKAAPKAKKGKK